jgi:tetratricopeptide (TPR) repeat protein
MQHDVQGNSLTAASAEAAAAFDGVIAGYLGYRADMPRRMEALFAADPQMPFAHLLSGVLAMLSYKQAAVQAARAAADAARAACARATPREQAHLAALDAWIAGAPDRAAALWEQILQEHPHDVLAFRLAHFVNFWLGRPDLMLASVLSAQKHWSADLPGYGSLLGCRCFALEECGHYTEAEAAGREAIGRDPGDLWAAHGVAHVLEMQGRRGEGIAWIEGLAGNWEGANNLQHHLFWHAAMFHLERGDTARVLALYDERFRNLASPLVQALPDLYIDLQNAASMLFRLTRQGVDVGGRWEELADQAEARIGDCLSGFTLPHLMMALAATGRGAAAERMLSAMAVFAAGNTTNAALVRDYALPVSAAVAAHGRGEYAQAVALMRPALGGMYRLGGSHAQQDVLEQVFLDAAVKGGFPADVRMLLERVAGRHKLPLQRRIGYAAAARELAFA